MNISKDNGLRAEMIKEFHAKAGKFFLTFSEAVRRYIVREKETYGFDVPMAERHRNSRGGKIVWRDKQHLSMGKWCEVCGSPFDTVTVERRLCDGCWEEVCGRMGFDYSTKPKLRAPTTVELRK